MSDPKCAVCEQPIQARQEVVFRADGHVVHVKCPEPARKPLARIGPEPETDPICPACEHPILPGDGVVKDGHDLLHILCWAQRQRPIAGGSSPTRVADERIAARRRRAV